MWSPYKVGLIEKIEKIHKRANTLVPACKDLAYADGKT